jgi:hypothetical protein
MTKHIHIHIHGQHDADEPRGKHSRTRSTMKSVRQGIPAPAEQHKERPRGKLKTRANMANHRFWTVAGVKGKGPHKAASMARAAKLESGLENR